MYKLIIEDDEGKTTIVPLIRDQVTIGRKEGNTIRLTERNVSRKHARLYRQEEALYIEDLTSYNGIKVNGDKIAGRSTVKEGDRIQIGDYHLAVKLDRPSDAPEREVRDDKTTPFLRDGAPRAMLDDVPTMQTPLGLAGRARLVVVSKNFAGREFVLDKAASVIGRTSDNDIGLDHRSISRRHAKVLREGDHFHIYDLGSSNGVRLNGEPYEQASLKPGDLIDLGHVRLRFVAQGEDFQFDRDAEVVDVGGTSLGKVVGAVAVMVAIAAFGYFKWGRPQVHEIRPPDNEAEVAKLLMEADRALKEETWETAIDRAADALKLEPGGSTKQLAHDKKQQAEAELKYRTSYQSFVAAADRGDSDSAIASFGEIGQNSAYRQKGEERFSEVKKRYLRTHLQAAKTARSGGRCEEARQHVEAVLTFDAGNLEAQGIVRTCSKSGIGKVAENDTPGVDRPSHYTEKANPRATGQPREIGKDHLPPTDEEDTVVSGGAEKLLQDAQDAYVNGDYVKAIAEAQRAAKTAPGKAWRIIGASKCFTKDRPGVMQAWNRLDSDGKKFLKYVCSRNAMPLP